MPGSTSASINAAMTRKSSGTSSVAMMSSPRLVDQLPVVQGVQSRAVDGGCDGREDQEGEERNVLQRGPQVDDQRDRAADHQEAADQLAPEDVTFLHERRHHLA